MSSESPSTSVQQDTNVVAPSESTCSSDVVKKDKKLTSPVWNDFTKFDKEIKSEVDGKEVSNKVLYARCNHCGFECPASSKQGTTRFKNWRLGQNFAK